jgi:hypothetical protein
MLGTSTSDSIQMSPVAGELGAVAWYLTGARTAAWPISTHSDAVASHT